MLLLNKIQVSDLTKKRWSRFSRIKRAYYSLLFLVLTAFASLFAEFIMNNKPIVIHYNSQWYFPIFQYYTSSEFGLEGSMEPHYRELADQWKSNGKGFIWMPFIPFGPYENDLLTNQSPPYAPSRIHWLGTDDQGRDILVRIFYGFRISLFFSVLLTLSSYIIGIIFGSLMGYFGSWTDLILQRGIEIWSTIPFLYICIIIASVFTPSFIILLLVLTAFEWMHMTYYIRTEMYREKAKDYASAAKALGAGHIRIIFKHLLPNSLVPLITYFPFSIVAGINALTALDFLGYGLPPPTPSWGELLNQGLSHLQHAYWITGYTFLCMGSTLILVTFIGEGVREAFDPKVFMKFE